VFFIYDWQKLTTQFSSQVLHESAPVQDVVWHIVSGVLLELSLQLSWSRHVSILNCPLHRLLYNNII